MIPDPIPTERLTLRPVTAADEAALLRFRGNPEVTRYLSHAPLGAAENSTRLRTMLSRAEASTPEQFDLCWAVVLRGTGEVIGDARTWTADAPSAPGPIPAAALGYLVHTDHHGRGYGREAAGALVRWLFEDRGVGTVLAGVYEPNLPSRRLLETLGFVPDHYFTAAQDRAGKGLPSWRYRLDRPPAAGPPAGHN
ncbi:GNAT family N-acetyltransferase [Pseudarthrobacter sp. L19]|uniref:GNAT family N-acetyltransferase n=1 Tax=Pseudarthrobacter sp. L19 TaxID=3423951 RepID=UPI003D78EBB3